MKKKMVVFRYAVGRILITAMLIVFLLFDLAALNFKGDTNNSFMQNNFDKLLELDLQPIMILKNCQLIYFLK